MDFSGENDKETKKAAYRCVLFISHFCYVENLSGRLINAIMLTVVRHKIIFSCEQLMKLFLTVTFLVTFLL